MALYVREKILSHQRCGDKKNSYPNQIAHMLPPPPPGVNSQVTGLSLARALSSLISGLLGFLCKHVFKLKLGHLYGRR